MRNIFVYIWKNHFFFLFLLLQVICFTLIIQNNYYQRAAFINKSNDFFGSITQNVDNVYAYFSLAQTNKYLATENAQLRNQQENSFKISDRKFFFVNDTLYQQQYKFFEAKVINNSVSKRKNFITINKGVNHGIKTNMGVISPSGVVGIVTGTSNNFSSVMSVLNVNSKISVKIKKNNHIGSLVWSGTNYRVAQLDDIPLHVIFEPGDTIITSGYSAIFPEGILVGTIKDSSYNVSDSFFKIDVELAVDFNNLSYVYIVENFFKREQKLLERQNQQ